MKDINNIGVNRIVIANITETIYAIITAFIFIIFAGLLAVQLFINTMPDWKEAASTGGKVLAVIPLFVLLGVGMFIIGIILNLLNKVLIKGISEKAAKSASDERMEIFYKYEDMKTAKFYNTDGERMLHPGTLKFDYRPGQDPDKLAHSLVQSGLMNESDKQEYLKYAWKIEKEYRKTKKKSAK